MKSSMRGRESSARVKPALATVAAVEADGGSLRTTLGAFATGVILVASDLDGKPVGLLANSFTSVSLEPPLVSLSLGSSSRTLRDLRRKACWGLSVLAAHQAHEFAMLSRRSDVRFEDLSTELGPGDSRLLPCSAATFVVSIESEFEAGDHRLFLLRVLTHSRRSTLLPLVFHGGKTGTLAKK